MTLPEIWLHEGEEVYVFQRTKIWFLNSWIEGRSFHTFSSTREYALPESTFNDRCRFLREATEEDIIRALEITCGQE